MLFSREGRIIFLSHNNNLSLLHQVVIVSEEFRGLTTLQRHRKVNNVLKEELAMIHAFTIETKTPGQ